MSQLMNLYPNKAHGHDMLSIRMMKLCENSICKPLSIIFNDCKNFTRFSISRKQRVVSSKEFLDVQATIECGFTLKRIRDMVRTYSLV